MAAQNMVVLKKFLYRCGDAARQSESLIVVRNLVIFNLKGVKAILAGFAEGMIRQKKLSSRANYPCEAWERSVFSH